MPTLINILAPERSGSTMLDLMLGSGPDVYSLGEIAAWFRLYRYRREASIPEAWTRLPNVDPKAVESAFSGSEADFHARAFEVLGATHLIDSSKEKCWIIETQDWGRTHGYDVFNLVIWKDPIDYAHSFWKRGRYDEWSRVYKRFYGWVLQSELPFVSVALDDLIDAPASVLEDLCTVCDMEYFPGKHQFWRFDHLNMDGSPGVKAQVENHASRIEKQPYYPEFLPLIDEVKQTIRDEGIDRLIDRVKDRSVSRFMPTSQGDALPTAAMERYEPSASLRLRNWMHIQVKRPWLRLRHNTVLADWL